ncbi:hypothetical protein [Actinoalloteichus hymeniacidonis]|uniref:ABC transporter n=1 Tax=Actinoalloteichus hymeniacidonis TaxID=340345 RepID=A0AAC9HSE4_9PSEU|nr:hypothetical protein [Actinoalloteichus hymeniacidonis]AOS64608.1 hypothetical protein TL08_19085 [Actinoalloteichus hymeniacidonis]MBB5907319.1 hypothetical protein [Actinoalloteichus hymeniacidonis]
MKTRRNPLLAGLAITMTASLAAACGGGGPAQDTAIEETTEAVPHGYVEGAEETAEAQSRLIVGDAETGAVQVVDLITEEIHQLDGIDGGVTGILGDGRFGYLTGADGATHVVDSGSWMVDHGDHVHYYRAEVRDVGTVSDEPATGAYSDRVVSAVSFEDTVGLWDRAELDAGTVAEAGEIPDVDIAVPYEEHLLTARDSAGIQVHDREGTVVSEIDEPCEAPRGQAVTRRGVVFGCADGALLISEDDDTFVAEKIAFDEPVADDQRPDRFEHRPDSTTLAAIAGDGVRTLDVTEGRWRHFELESVVAVNAVGEGAPVLALTADGVLHALDPETGEQLAENALLSAEAAGGDPAPVIQVDTSRAYLNDPTSGELFEIDYQDDLRVARDFTVDGKASYLVETGR